MKKRTALFFIITSLLLSVNCFGWTPVQLSFWEGTKNLPNSKNVYGLKLGLPYSSSYWGINQVVDGLELSLVTESYGMNGFQLSYLNVDTEDCSGFQLSVVNMSKNFDGFELGVYNEIIDGSTAVQIAAVNTCKRKSTGIQIAAINNAANETKGVQVGVINTSYDFKGVQVGIINTNFRKSSSSVQVGLFNYMEDGFLPLCPFVNFKL